VIGKKPSHANRVSGSTPRCWSWHQISWSQPTVECVCWFSQISYRRRKIGTAYSSSEMMFCSFYSSPLCLRCWQKENVLYKVGLLVSKSCLRVTKRYLACCLSRALAHSHSHSFGLFYWIVNYNKQEPKLVRVRQILVSMEMHLHHDAKFCCIELVPKCEEPVNDRSVPVYLWTNYDPTAVTAVWLWLTFLYPC